MPRMLAISSVASSGMRRWAARRSAPLYDPRRRLPEIPSTLVIAPPDQPRACRAGGRLATRAGGNRLILLVLHRGRGGYSFFRSLLDTRRSASLHGLPSVSTCRLAI